MARRTKDTNTIDCPGCDCGLFVIVTDANTGKIIAVECNMCGEYIKIEEWPRIPGSPPST